MAKLDCDTCVPDIQTYYENSARIVELNHKLVDLAMDSAQGSKILCQGRVVVLRDDVSQSCDDHNTNPDLA